MAPAVEDYDFIALIAETCDYSLASAESNRSEHTCFLPRTRPFTLYTILNLDPFSRSSSAFAASIETRDPANNSKSADIK